MTDIKLEILAFSHWEHFKALKDLSRVLPHDHPRIIQLQEEVNKLATTINHITEKIN